MLMGAMDPRGEIVSQTQGSPSSPITSEEIRRQVEGKGVRGEGVNWWGRQGEQSRPFQAVSDILLLILLLQSSLFLFPSFSVLFSPLALAGHPHAVFSSLILLIKMRGSCPHHYILFYSEGCVGLFGGRQKRGNEANRNLYPQEL